MDANGEWMKVGWMLVPSPCTSLHLLEQRDEVWLSFSRQYFK
jgi:hypothetical protein